MGAAGDGGAPGAYSLGSQAYLAAGWSAPIPVGNGRRNAPPKGFTGEHGRDPQESDVRAWRAARGEDCIALRLPPGVVGIDVDAHDGKAGLETLRTLEAAFGPLPPTWSSTSREDGSRIMFFRAPGHVGQLLRDLGPGIEVIRRGHRYAVVWPSVSEKTARVYRWYRPGGELAPEGAVPAPGELAQLPEGWYAASALEGAQRGAAGAHGGGAGSGGGGYTDRDVDTLLLSGVPAGQIQDVALRDLVWKLVAAGGTDAQIELQWLAVVSKTPQLDPDRPWTKDDFSRHLKGAREKLGEGVPPIGERPDWARPRGSRTRRTGEGVDVTSVPDAADWLLEELGTDRLAGIFYRDPGFVFTACVGQEGYTPLTEDPANDDGPAQVRGIDAQGVAARVRHRYRVYKCKISKGVKVLDAEGKAVTSSAMFPLEAAKDVLAAPEDAPNLKVLRGVVHTPTFRMDGSLIEEPGYDTASKVLYLPEPGVAVKAVPPRPSRVEVACAVALLDQMIEGFPFRSAHDRANYLGLLITPLLRTVAPPPYKLGAFEAHQPGSGKTLLAETIRWIHGGVFRVEFPGKDEELSKQVTSILDATTGSVVLFDNVSGALRSSVLAGLLTSDRWDDRRLGASEMISRPNDRLWMITGNNLHIGGDLARRTLRVEIDPGVPSPELRTGFAIPALREWVAERRGELLHALLTLVRAWVAEGAPLALETSSDGYARWIRTVRGILQRAGIEGIFDDTSTKVEVGADDDDWGTFLEAVRRVFGEAQWTAKEVLAQVGDGDGQIPPDVLPSGMGRNGKMADLMGDYTGLSKSLGRFCENRNLRWAGELCVESRGVSRTKTKLWRVRSYAGVQGLAV